MVDQPPKCRATQMWINSYGTQRNPIVYSFNGVAFGDLGVECTPLRGLVMRHSPVYDENRNNFCNRCLAQMRGLGSSLLSRIPISIIWVRRSRSSSW
jgi:hypothetical protein